MATLAAAHKVEPAAGYFQVTSARSGKTYRVTPFGGDAATCSCEAGRRGQVCSHLKAVRDFAQRTLTREGFIAYMRRRQRAVAATEKTPACTCGAGSWRAHTVGCPALTAPADVFECRCGQACARPGHVVDGEAFCSEACYDRTAEGMWTGSAR